MGQIKLGEAYTSDSCAYCITAIAQFLLLFFFFLLLLLIVIRTEISVLTLAWQAQLGQLGGLIIQG